MSDKTIKCFCGKDFIFTEGEQEYFKDRKLQTPKYCHDCRIERRKKFTPAPVATGFFATNKADRELLGE
jgi:hypothetical protein